MEVLIICKPVQWSAKQIWTGFYMIGTTTMKELTILGKISIWDVWLGLEYSSAGGYDIAFKIQTDISLVPSKDRKYLFARCI